MRYSRIAVRRWMMPRHQLLEEELTGTVIGAFFEVYNTLGYGFLEHLYVRALERELLARGRGVAREVTVPVYYKGAHLGYQRIDMIVDDKLVVETKAAETLHKASFRQLHSYLRATRLQVGLLLHFAPDEARFHRFISSRDGKSA